MLSEFFDSPLRVQELRDSPGGHLLEGFAQELFKSGYAEITARRHIRAAEHFMYWKGREGIPASSLTEQLLDLFDGHLDQCQCPGYGHTHRLEILNGVRLFLRHLRSAGVITTSGAETKEQDPVLLDAFYEWMRQQRGTSDRTLYNYSISIRSLLKRFGEDPGRFDAQSLREFVLEKSQKRGWAAAKTCTTALRMFLRFLIAEGKCAAGLDAAIPVLAHWRLSSLPRYLQPEEVERVIASCDSNHARLADGIMRFCSFSHGWDFGRGISSGFVWEISIGTGAWIHVSGKGRRQTRLALTQEVGDAVVAYLQDGRPRTDTDVLFVRSRAPFRAFKSHSAISVIVAQAMRRAGVTCPSRGAAHVLRHSVATSMLRQGASLQDIAVVLRHRSIETTQIYAKVDVTALRQIAQPWPEVQPC